MGFGSSTACRIGLNTTLSPEDREIYGNTGTIRRILGTARRVAVVGMSTERTKASNMVGSYLRDEGYEVIPVNPRAKEIDGLVCYPDLASIPGPIDLVDVFRPSGELMGIVEEAIAVGAKAVWSQLRIVDAEAGTRAREAGLDMVMDKCVKMEHGRFGGSLHWAGMNTEVITARRMSARR